MADLDKAVETMKRNLAVKSGRSLDEWVKLVRAQGALKHGQIVTWLKATHALGHGYANLVASEALSTSAAGGTTAGGDDLVTAQYAGKKAPLLPLYEALIAKVQGFGGDVEVSAKKTYVSLRRAKQFALIQPSTAERLDIGINLKGDAATGRLEASGSFNAMVSHRVRVANAKDIDKDLIGWLREAYNRAG